jgi:predicted amidohydrolase
VLRKNKIKIALAQYPILQHQSLSAWKEYIEKWILDAVAKESDLLVFPEYASIELISFASENVQKNLKNQFQYLCEMNNTYTEFFQGMARQHGVFILAPSIPFHSIEKQKTVNRSYIFSKTGQINFQDKLFMTRSEDELWGISSSEAVVGEFVQKIFETEIGNISISPCLDIEFSEPSFSAAASGAEILLAPTMTDTIQGCHRVHIGARARALENQFYVGVSQVVGEADWSIAASKNFGFSALYATPDADFPEDGVLAKGQIGTAGWLTAHVFLDKISLVRKNGNVLNFQRRQSLPGFGKIKYQIDVLR